MAVAVALCLFGILASGFFAQRFDAEAVIGGQGNLRSESGHKHNFSAGSGGVEAQDETRICVFCHTPHHAIGDDSGASLINAPLWNHTLSDPDLTYTVKSKDATYTNSITGDVYLHSQPLNKPDGASRLCLSCHDGTVSVGDVRSVESGIQMDTSGGGCLDTDGSIANTCSAYIGTDLTGKHVVSVPMNQALLDNSAGDCGGAITTKLDYPMTHIANVLLRPTTATYGGNPGVTPDPVTYPEYKSGYNYGVQCSTCHDPHYWKPDADSDGQADAEGEYFVVTDTSSLCSACHVSCT